MLRALLYLLTGVVIGGAIFGEIVAGHQSAPPSAVQPCVSSCNGLKQDLQAAQMRVAALESELLQHQHHPAPTAQAHSDSHVSSEYDSIDWRISAIDKFVPLSQEQRERLRDKYLKEQAGEGEKAESLDEILGGENAAFYRERVGAAFKRAREEEIERDVIFMSRKLALSDAQENAMRSVMAEVAEQISAERAKQASGATPQERVRNMIEDNRKRTQLLNDKLRDLLTPKQFEIYLRNQAESSESDVEIFHEPAIATPRAAQEQR